MWNCGYVFGVEYFGVGVVVDDYGGGEMDVELFCEVRFLCDVDF